ncbi:BLUF domain-containing protein [Spirosoma flavum]|uniref:BLUF domain-containing protein n=1 Tax=Spirosoma flavum TaxID=2048557 RepID=A0ABW6AU13_9BACT
MLLSLTAIDEEGQTRDFFCLLRNMETGFDLLSAISAKGHILIQAHVLEDDVLTDLPLEVFDGQPFSDDIQLLEKDWQQILDQPASSGTSNMEDVKTDYCTVYFSTSVGSLVENDLSVILKQSRFNNAKSGITGILLYINGNIIQVLEGDDKAVETLYHRIEKDPRHTNLVRVLNKPIDQRLFADWSMGYETITSRQLENIREIVDTDANQAAGNPIILKTLKAFYETNRLR